MKNSKKIITEQPNIVDEYYIGKTFIQTADNYFKEKTREDVQKILDRLTKIAVDSYNRQQQFQLD